MTAIDAPRDAAGFDDAIAHPQDDLLGSQLYAARLAEFIDKLHPPFTIGVYGEWGSGKTTLVRLMAGELRKLHPDLKFIVFEAWPYKTTDDLWRALVQRIAYELHEVEEPPATARPVDEPPPESFATRLVRRLAEPAVRFRRDPEPPKKFKEYYDLLQRLDDTRYGGTRSRPPGQLLDEEGAVTALVQGAVAALGNLSPLLAAMRGFFGIDAKADVAQLLEQEKNETARNRIKSVKDFRDAVRELFDKKRNGRTVCVFIDDLDRCMPDVALDLLEALKIFLDDAGCIFVVAADEQLIGEGLRIRFKELLAIERTGDATLFPRKGREYFEKIIQLGIRVPGHDTHVHGFIAAQFPQWLASTDLIQFAAGSNPRRLKQYCTWLDYKYMVVRDPKDAADDWPLLTKLVELQSRSAAAVDALRRLAQEQEFATLMKSVESGPREGMVNTAALELYDLAAENKQVRKILEAKPLFSDAEAAELEAVAGFVDIVPDTASERMLKGRDGLLIRLFEKVVRTDTAEEGAILDDDLLKLDELMKLEPGLAPILKQLAQRSDWSDVMDSVESSLQGGPNARQADAAAAPLMAFVKDKDEVKTSLLTPQRLSAVLPEIVRHWTPRSVPMSADTIEEIKDAIGVRLRAARHFVKRRKFVKLDAFDHAWPEVFQFMRSDRAGLRTFESNISDPNQRTQDLLPKWLAYTNDEKLLAFLRLRPYVADILEEDVKKSSSVSSAVVRPMDAAPMPPPAPVPVPTVVVPAVQPLAAPPAPVLSNIVTSEAYPAAANVPRGFLTTFVDVSEAGGIFRIALRDAAGLDRSRRKLTLDFSQLLRRADDLREYIRTHPDQFGGMLREFGGELYQIAFGLADLGLDDLLTGPESRRFCLSVPPDLEKLPWELLYVPSQRFFLGLNPHHSLVRLVTPTQPRASFLGSVEPPLRIMAFLNRPERQTARLKEEEELLSRLAPSDHVTVDVLSGEKATLRELESAVRIQQPHVLHFSGFRDDALFQFPDKDMPIPAFIQWLGESRVRLLDLTGCYVPLGGTTLSVSLASDVVKGGVPMVINTTSPITSEAVLVFTRDFYRTLAEGRSIDEALIEARQSQSKERWDWSAFALFTSEPSLGELRAVPDPMTRGAQNRTA